MRIGNVNGRAALVLGQEVADVAEASEGRFGPDLMGIYDDFDTFVDFAKTVTTGTGPLVESDLGCPVPEPRQVFAIGLNYRSHAEESGMALPEKPATFTKFPASLGGPFDDVEIVGGAVDWEVELVCVADRYISDRHLQFAAGAQFSLGKSRRGYGPMGPWVSTLDEVVDPNDLALGCSIDGEVVQDARTSDLIFDIPTLIAELSSVLPLLPGDVIFTGTPAGVGVSRQPARFLAPGEILESWIEGIGTIRNRCV